MINVNCRVQDRNLNSGGFILYFDYYPWDQADQGGRLAHTTYGNTIDPALFQDLSYTYLPTGSFDTIQNGSVEKWHYEYDADNRLTLSCLLDPEDAFWAARVSGLTKKPILFVPVK